MYKYIVILLILFFSTSCDSDARSYQLGENPESHVGEIVEVKGYLVKSRGPVHMIYDNEESYKKEIYKNSIFVVFIDHREELIKAENSVISVVGELKYDSSLTYYIDVLSIAD